MTRPLVKAQGFWADFANGIMLRPVYRPSPKATSKGPQVEPLENTGPLRSPTGVFHDDLLGSVRVTKAEPFEASADWTPYHLYGKREVGLPGPGYSAYPERLFPNIVGIIDDLPSRGSSLSGAVLDHLLHKVPLEEGSYEVYGRSMQILRKRVSGFPRDPEAAMLFQQGTSLMTPRGLDEARFAIWDLRVQQFRSAHERSHHMF